MVDEAAFHGVALRWCYSAEVAVGDGHGCRGLCRWRCPGFGRGE